MKSDEVHHNQETGAETSVFKVPPQQSGGLQSQVWKGWSPKLSIQPTVAIPNGERSPPEQPEKQTSKLDHVCLLHIILYPKRNLQKYVGKSVWV